MKRKTRIGLAIATLGVGVLALAGCTSSFCSTTDKAHMLAAYDNGVSRFYNADDASKPTENCYEIQLDGVNNIWFDYKYTYNNGGLTKTIETAQKNNVATQDIEGNCQYWASMDLVIIEKAIAESKRTINSADEMNLLLTDYGYMRFASKTEDNKLWDEWNNYDALARTRMREYGEAGLYGISYDIDKVPSSDFITIYKSTLESAISNYRGCITTDTGNFGNFGWDTKVPVEIEGKTYSYAWSKGFFEGLLVYPIAALTDVMCSSFAHLGNGLNGTNGWAQLLTIVLVTLIVRAFMFLVSFKSTLNNAKMTELQPQLAKIQAKYPNSNTNQYEKQRLAQETQALYKKHKINPFMSLIVMVVQFPVFICVWGAMQGSAQLSSGSVLNLNLSTSISSVLTTWANWGNPINSGLITALVLFLLMAGAQAVAMLLPQWMQVAKKKKIAKLGRNPAQKESDNKMKWFTYIMLAMIIFMGFSLVSALGVYWFVGALFSIGQTLITNAIMNHKPSKKGSK